VNSSAALRPWHRLGVRLAVLFAIVTLLAVGFVGFVVYTRQAREIEATVGVQLLNIARTAVLLVDAGAHAAAQSTANQDSEAYRRVRTALATIRESAVLPTPVFTLTDLDVAGRQARLVVTSDDGPPPGTPYPLAPEVIQPLAYAFEDGFARVTGIYHDARGTWITAFAPITDAAGKTTAVLTVDYSVEIFMDRLHDLRNTLLYASLGGGLLSLIAGLLFARGVTRPLSALTSGVERVTGGDLSQALPVRSRDEVGRLTRAFNHMLEGLRQRDFIRSTFGRYVSPEVAQTLLESPEALRLGGDKRVVTLLMSDLRGYTRFAERADPAVVLAALNDYLGRMTDVIVEHGGTINEFMGDGIFAVFGAPFPRPDHAERAAGAALAMQQAMAEINRSQAARGLPRFDMGIGINTGEAVVGNVGSEQRAKYSVVGNTVNTAARVESATVGGQVLISAATLAEFADKADVGPPLSVQVKGLSEPLVLYELHALRGRFARAMPAMEAAADTSAEVALPARYWLIEGKTIQGDGLTGTVVRLGTRRLTLRLDTVLPALANVRLRLCFPAAGQESDDLYGKVIDVEQTDGVCLARVHLTSVDEADRKAIEALVSGGA
jgi:class 3 adenylate cyclase